MGPGRALAGLAAIAVPAGLVVFGLVMATAVGWRNWFRIEDKESPPKTKDDPPKD